MGKRCKSTVEYVNYQEHSNLPESHGIREEAASCLASGQVYMHLCHQSCNAAVLLELRTSIEVLFLEIRYSNILGDIRDFLEAGPKARPDVGNI